MLAQRHGAPCVLDGQGCASDYAEQLLTTLGAHVQRSFLKTDISADRAWAQSGAMALTGRSDGPPQPCPAPLAACVEGVRVALRTLAGQPVDLPDAATLGERAALSGLTRNGSISPGGACRLLPAADGWLAVNLPRPDDWSLLAAWLETPPLANGNWEGLASALSLHTWENLCERGTLLGLAVAALQPANNTADAPATTARPWFQIVAQGPPRLLNRHTPPLVIDLSALWAGPFCAHLLQQLGMRVIKVESRQRPDGARHGPTAFYDLLNQGKASVTFDFSVAADLHRLRALLRRADIVIESSRPRGLRQLGIHAEELVATTPGLTWLAISGYGRDAAHENRIAYGDDAGVSGGLSALLFKQTGEPMFCGDAIADPLTGWHAALAALASQQSGGGRLISLALSDVVAHCAQHPQSDGHSIIATEQIAPPRARRAQAPARALGADTVEILSELGIAC